jgi:hypothetical protein
MIAVNTEDLERIAARDDNMPKNLFENEKCLFLFLRCLNREYSTGILPAREAQREKQSFLQHYNNTNELREIYFSYIKTWTNCEHLFTEVEKSTCDKCETCETCRRIARIIDGRERNITL